MNEMNRPGVFSSAGSPPPDTAASTLAETDALLPKTLGGVFDEAFDLYKRHFTTLALIVAIAYLPVQILLHALFQTWLRPLAMDTQTPGNTTPDFGNIFLLVIGAVFIGAPQNGVPGLLSLGALIFAAGAVTLAVNDLYVGKTPTARDVYRRTRPYFFRLLSGWASLMLAFIGIFFVSLIILSMLLGIVMTALGSSVLAPEIAVVFSIVAMFVPYIASCAITARSYIFTTPLIVLEHLPAIQVTSRNSLLVGKTRFRRTVWAVFFLPIVTFGLQMLVLGSASSALTLIKLPPFVLFLTDAAMSAAISFFFQPYWMIFVTLLYFDYRVRREGLDVRLLSAAFPSIDGQATE